MSVISFDSITLQLVGVAVEHQCFDINDQTLFLCSRNQYMSVWYRQKHTKTLNSTVYVSALHISGQHCDCFWCDPGGPGTVSCEPGATIQTIKRSERLKNTRDLAPFTMFCGTYVTFLKCRTEVCLKPPWQMACLALCSKGAFSNSKKDTTSSDKWRLTQGAHNLNTLPNLIIF